MANLYSVQEQLRVIKSGDEREKKASLTPQSIADVRAFIAKERENRPSTNASLEGDFREWEELIARFESDKGGIRINTANATAHTASSLSSVQQVVTAPLPQSVGVGPGEQLVDPTSERIRETLDTINPNTLEQAINLSEQAINLIRSEETKNTLRGVHGAIIFQILRDAGHNLIVQNGQITIIPKPGTDVVNLQEKLQTLVNTRRMSLESIKRGMLYSSKAFSEYVDTKKTQDSQGRTLIDPKASTQDFITYLSDLQKAGNNNPDVISILESKSMLSSVNMQQAIKGFQDMGQVKEWQEKNQKVMQKFEAKFAASAQSSVGAPEARATLKSAPTEPNTTLTGKLTQDGVTGGHVTGFVGDSTKGLIHGIGDILSLGKGDPIATLAIGGGLIYGIYKAFQKFGFLGGIGTLFGLGAMNNIDKILGRFGVGTVAEGIDKATKKAEEIAGVAKKKVGEVAAPTAPVAKEETKADTTKKVDVSNLSEFQRAGVKTIESNKSLLEDITNHANNNPRQNASIEEYIQVVHKDSIQNITLDKIIYTPIQQQSIFSEETQSLFGENPDIPNNISRRLLKQTIRSYIGINEPLSLSVSSGNGNTPKMEGQDTWDNFKKKYPQDKWKNRTLRDLITEIYKTK